MNYDGWDMNMAESISDPRSLPDDVQIARVTRTQMDALIVSMVEGKNKAGQLGLWKTVHALDEALKVVGWEVAEWMEGKKG